MKKHYHLIGIGGIGMGTLASLLLAKGQGVSGSDIKENKVTLQLREKGATIFIGHDSSHVADADFVVFSSAIKADNPEMLAAVNKRIEIFQRAEFLAELMNDHTGITVAGAHGKTTTTSMISDLFLKAGLKPTTAVGGIVKGHSLDAKIGEGQYFVSEVDESDGSFLYFSPTYSIITNIDFEHLDYYLNWDNILDAYGRFIDKTKEDGLIIAYGEDERLMALLKEGERNFLTYGFSFDCDIYADNISFNAMTSEFDCIFKRKFLGRIKLGLPGRHNILNALSCICLGLILSIDFSVIQESLSGFPGVQRRFQIVGEIDDILVVDDYAHHPTEIKMTLDAARQIKKKRVIALFQPHRYSRLQSLTEEFAKSFEDCDFLIVTDVYAASEKPIKGVDAKQLCQMIKQKTPDQMAYLKKEKIVQFLLNIVQSGDLVISLGAGDITQVAYAFVSALKEKEKDCCPAAVPSQVS